MSRDLFPQDAIAGWKLKAHKGTESLSESRRLRRALEVKMLLERTCQQRINSLSSVMSQRLPMLQVERLLCHELGSRILNIVFMVSWNKIVALSLCQLFAI